MDVAAVPEGAERWCSEAVVRLPHGRFYYAPPDYAPAVIDPTSRKASDLGDGEGGPLDPSGRELSL